MSDEQTFDQGYLFGLPMRLLAARMSDERERTFDQGYLFGLLALDRWIRDNLSPNTTVEKIRAELIALMNDKHYGTFSREVDDARSNRCE